MYFVPNKQPGEGWGNGTNLGGENKEVKSLYLSTLAASRISRSLDSRLTDEQIASILLEHGRNLRTLFPQIVLEARNEYARRVGGFSPEHIVVAPLWGKWVAGSKTPAPVLLVAETVKERDIILPFAAENFSKEEVWGMTGIIDHDRFFLNDRVKLE